MKVGDLVEMKHWHQQEVGIVTLTGRYEARRGSPLDNRWAIVYWFSAKQHRHEEQKYLKVVNESR